MVNLLAYALGAINLFNSDRPHHKRIRLHRVLKRTWAWARRHPTPATIVLGFAALLVLFAILAWGW